MTCLICPCYMTRSCQPCDGTYNKCRFCQGSKPNGWWSPEKAIGCQNLSGKTYMITGANSGIGFVTAQTILIAGAKVIVVTRTANKTSKTINRLIEGLSPSTKERVKGMSMDLSSLSSVRAGVKKFDKLGVQRLDAICLNAGVMLIPEFSETEDGLEMHWGINHVGHFYLLKLLVPTIQRFPGHTRIIVVSSITHSIWTPNNFTVDIHLPPKRKAYDRCKNYGISKLCNILMAREIANRFNGKGISAYSCHPGFISGTSLYRYMPSFVPTLFQCCAYLHCGCLWHADFKTVPVGASTQLYLMTQPLIFLHSGGYYAGCRLQNEKSPMYKYATAESDEEARKLWELTERIIADRTKKI